MPDPITDPLITQSTSYPEEAEEGLRPSSLPMLSHASRSARAQLTASPWIVASGATDWVLVLATAVGGYYLGKITPNKRPFRLENPDIAFPFADHETVTPLSLIISSVGVPAIVIIVVTLVTTPGIGTPSGVPRALVWRQKLWEMYASLLSLGLSLASQQFIINGLKNLCGKPRPDMLSRCQPDTSNLARYVVGGFASTTSNGQLVSADICTSTDTSRLNDGFRSYPSGHAASAAAGLGFLALYLALKFGVAFPFALPPFPGQNAALGASAFPSRPYTARQDAFALQDLSASTPANGTPANAPAGKGLQGTQRSGTASWADQEAVSMRRSGAAPPLYLLVVVLAPFFASVFIAASRWFDFRHHGFDIIFGYGIGAATGLVAFRLYHLPLTYGAGWAWGPRSNDKAFWAGVGSHSWADPWHQWPAQPSDEESFFQPAAQYTSGTPGSSVTHRPSVARHSPLGDNAYSNSRDGA